MKKHLGRLKYVNAYAPTQTPEEDLRGHLQPPGWHPTLKVWADVWVGDLQAQKGDYVIHVTKCPFQDQLWSNNLKNSKLEHQGIYRKGVLFVLVQEIWWLIANNYIYCMHGSMIWVWCVNLCCKYMVKYLLRCMHLGGCLINKMTITKMW